MKRKLFLTLAIVMAFAAAVPAMAAPQKTNGYIEADETYGAFAAAEITKLSGSQNELTITIAIEGNIIAEGFFHIPNNSAGEFEVGEYKVYVSSYGNDKIDCCFITFAPEPKDPYPQVWLHTLHPWLRYWNQTGNYVFDWAAHDDYFEFLTNPENWDYVSKNLDAVQLFGYITWTWTDGQVEAFCDMVKATGIKVAFEMGGMLQYQGVGPKGSEAEARFWFEAEGLGQTAILRMIEHGVYVDYINFDGSISRVMGTQNDPRKTMGTPDMTIEEACDQIVWLIKCYQEVLPEAKFNYLWNFPNHSWKGGYALTYYNDSQRRMGWGDVYEEMQVLDAAVKASGVPLVGFTIDAPYNYRATGDSSMISRVLDFEQEARALGYRVAIVFNSDVDSRASSFNNLSGQFYKESLQYIDDYEKLGGSPDVYILESWYNRAPAKHLPETEPYTLTYLAAEALRHIKEGKPIDVSGLDFRVPAFTWKWPGSGTIPSSGNGNGGSPWTTWTNSGLNSGAILAVAGNVLQLSCTDGDPYFALDPANITTYAGLFGIGARRLSVEAATQNGGCQFLHLRLKNYTEFTAGTFFFLKGSEWHSISYNMLPASAEPGWQDIYIDLKSNPDWTGTINRLRIDPAEGTEPGDFFEFELIELIRY